MMKKIFAIALVISISFWAVGPVSATTEEDLQAQIDALLETIAALQEQLAGMGGGSGSGAGCMCDFTRNLYPGMSGDDVKCLQEYLNASGHQVAASGVGSPGSETTYYGSLTRTAVKSWQDANGIEYGAYWGYFGPSTQAKYDAVCEADDDDDDDDDDPDVDGDALGIQLSASTPESTNVADGANAKFTKLVFTAGDDDVEIDKIYVYRTGLTANSDLENVKIVDEDGAYYGNIGSFNTNNKAMITFTSPLEIEDGESETYYIQAGFGDGKTAGRTASLGIDSADDVECDADVEGNFPIMGNPMTIVDIAIGSATFVEDGTTLDSTPDIGDTDVVLNQFKVSAGSTEGITIESLTAMETGSASLDDIENIELYSVTDGVTLAEVDGWNASGKAHWSDLDLSIGKGETHRFYIRADIVDGAGLTINADYEDGSDVLAQVKGDVYGFYITATDAGNGKGSNNQTINSGALTVTKSSNTPATGNIAQGDDQELTVLDFLVNGEDARISSLKITCATSAGNMLYTEVTNIKIYDGDDNIVAGPADLDSDFTNTFSDVFIAPVGTTEYTIKAKISSDTSALDDIKCGIAANGDITAKGMTTNESITASASTVYGNYMAVAAAHLTATTLTSPAAQTISQGANDFVFAEISLDAGSSGENVNVTALQIYDATSTAGTFSNLDNIAIWADLDSSDSSRGDAYETRVSDLENPGSGNGRQSFTLTETITVPKGTFIKVAVVADLAQDATDTGEHTVRLYKNVAGITAAGADTGTDTATTPTGDGQMMTVTTGGTLTLTVDSSSPIADIVLSEATGVTLGIFRLAASAVEALDLDSFKITDDGTSGNDIVDTFYFYYGDTLLGAKPGAANTEIQVADDAAIVPKDGHIEITVKADFNKVDGTSVVNGDTIEVTVNTTSDVDTTGADSGSAVDNTDEEVDCAIHTLYESRPYFSLNSGSPSGDLIPNANDELAIFDVEAHANEDISFVSTAASNSMIFQISDTVGGSTSTGTWTLKDGDGTQLATTSVDSGHDSTVTFDNFSNNTEFIIPAGSTKKLYVYGDTTDYTTDGDVIQIWLDDSANDIDWSIDKAGSYNVGDVIFKGDIYAGSFVNPS